MTFRRSAGHDFFHIFLFWLICIENVSLFKIFTEMAPRFSEMNKIRVNCEKFGQYEGYVIPSQFRDGRWIYKISISREKNEEWGQSSLLTLVMRERLPVNCRSISQDFSPAGVTLPFVARAMPTRSSDKRLRKYANLAAAAASARV
jgi:hypothetical protein